MKVSDAKRAMRLPWHHATCSGGTDVPTICEGLWGHGYRDHAQRLFARYKSTYLSDRYGAAVTTADGIEERLRDAGADLPLDPLYAPFFAVRARFPAQDARAEAAAVIRTGEANANHPVFGPRLRKLADHARLLEATAAGAKPDRRDAGLVLDFLGPEAVPVADASRPIARSPGNQVIARSASRWRAHRETVHVRAAAASVTRIAMARSRRRPAQHGNTSPLRFPVSPNRMSRVPETRPGR